jgi:hypothetical protein
MSEASTSRAWARFGAIVGGVDFNIVTTVCAANAPAKS